MAINLFGCLFLSVTDYRLAELFAEWKSWIIHTFFLYNNLTQNSPTTFFLNLIDTVPYALLEVKLRIRLVSKLR